MILGSSYYQFKSMDSKIMNMLLSNNIATAGRLIQKSVAHKVISVIFGVIAMPFISNLITQHVKASFNPLRTKIDIVSLSFASLFAFLSIAFWILSIIKLNKAGRMLANIKDTKDDKIDR